MEISDRIKHLLDRSGLKQKDLAGAIGATEAQISSWKKGRNEPDTDNLIKIAEYFGVPLAWLRHGVPPAPDSHEPRRNVIITYDDGNSADLQHMAETQAPYDAKAYSMERIVLARQLVESLLRILVDLHKMGLLDEEYRQRTNMLIQALTRQVMDRLEGRYPDGT